MTKHPYTYTVLRYMHDIGTSEFVNVGIVVCSRSARFVTALMNPSCERVSRMFPGMDEMHFRDVIGHVQQRFDDISKELSESSDLAFEHAHAATFSVITQDDSAFQWSPMGSGIAADLPAVVQSIYKPDGGSLPCRAVDIHRVKGR
jgi:hypothetical protein